MTQAASRPDVTIRDVLRPGDLGEIVRLHGVIYEREYGLDATFEPYVAGPLARFAIDHAARGDVAGGIWIAGDCATGQMLGSIAIVAPEADAAAQVGVLRWFLLVPEARGTGTGRKLLTLAIDGARDRGWSALSLWTFDALAAAIALYERAGFVEVERHTHVQWGQTLTEVRMEMGLS